MSGWYVLKESGIISAKMRRGRGRPPKGWERFDGDDPAPALPETKSAKEKKQKKTFVVSDEMVPEKLWLIRRDTDGHVIEKSPTIRREHVPAGYERVTHNELLRISGLKLESTEITSEDRVTTPVEDNPAISNVQDIEECKVIAVNKEVGDSYTQHFTAKQTMALRDLANMLNYRWLEYADNDGVITWLSIFVADRAEDCIDILHLGQSIAKMEIVRSNGDLRIWSHDGTAPYPDIILEAAITDIEGFEELDG